MFQRILIANRGEIACRVIRTCRRLGIESVAVYSEADVSAMHVREADVAVEIGGARPADSYLNIERLMAAARQTGAEAIHPGYGFLAENAGFARACEKAGIAFIGPKPSTIDRMGSKAEAKALMDKAGVPIVPGYHGEDQKDKTLHAEADRIGFPLMIKPAAGGGGKGMRIVHDADGFGSALEGARRESDNAFGDTRMILERYVEGPRHIEFQVFGDNQGEVIHLYERECSVQRRYQKIIEETPSPFLDEDTRLGMGDAAVKAAHAVDYVGAGTVEFIVGADREFFFMEMNTRLQVEHPVTEMTTGIDLVEWQIRVAAGKPLPVRQDAVRPHGHAIEARLYAEDPYQNFMPSSGPLRRLRLPSTSDHVRIDSGVAEGDSVTIHYDPMIAKLIVHDATRQTAVARLQQALEACYVDGLATNIGFLVRLAHHPRFLEATIDTGYLDRHLDEVLPADPELPADALAAAAAHWLLEREARVREAARDTGDPWSPWATADAWHPGVAAARPLTFRHGQAEHGITATGSGGDYELTLGDRRLRLSDTRIVADGIRFVHDGETRHLGMARLGRGYQVNCRGARWHLSYVDPFDRLAAAEADEHRITSPMPGRVVAVKTKEGDSVAEGQELVVLEAMKMEITLRAPHDGTVAKVLHEEGDFVEADVALVELDREASDS
jgi:3-methylcrotonyl-CoA carboxylase alpha subunit